MDRGSETQPQVVENVKEKLTGSVKNQCNLCYMYYNVVGVLLTFRRIELSCLAMSQWRMNADHNKTTLLSASIYIIPTTSLCGCQIQLLSIEITNFNYDR